MNILLVGQNLQIGGVQTALVNLLKSLAKKEGATVELFLFGDGELTKEIPASIQVHYGNRALRLVATPFQEVVNKRNVFEIVYRTFLMLLVRLMGSNRFYTFLFKNQNKLKMFDVAISYFNDVPDSYFNQGTNQFVRDFVDAESKLAWIHTDPIQSGFDKMGCRKMYKDFDRLVCVSEACSEKLKAFLPEYTDKITTVYNFFPIEEIREKALENGEVESSFLSFVTVTRIDNGSKNLRRIAKVCEMLEKKGIRNYKWTIIGDGPDREKNQKEINEKGLSRRVKYIGSRVNPYTFVANSDLFILTSNYEGFPMVIQEALILGVPVLTTPYAAVKEQVEHGINGIVTDMSVESIYHHLEIILENPFLLEDLKDGIQLKPVTNQMADNQLKSVLGAFEDKDKIRRGRGA